jgi:hypothetical protein
VSCSRFSVELTAIAREPAAWCFKSSMKELILCSSRTGHSYFPTFLTADVPAFDPLTESPRPPLPPPTFASSPRHLLRFALQTDMPPAVVAYDPPPRSRPRTRLSSGFEAVEHLASDAQQVAAEVERAARFGETMAEDYREAYPGGWLNQPVGTAPRSSKGSGRRRQEEEQTTDEDDQVEEWEDPPSPKPKKRSGRTMVSEGGQTTKGSLKGRVSLLGER